MCRRHEDNWKLSMLQVNDIAGAGRSSFPWQTEERFALELIEGVFKRTIRGTTVEDQGFQKANLILFEDFKNCRRG